MKAWVVTDEFYEYSTVVFAETRSKARMIAQSTDCCEDMDYINISPRRFKEADTRYRGKNEMDWFDPDDRKFLVENGWSCVEPEFGDCPNCPAADLCDKYKDYQCEAREEEVENG